MPETQPLVGLSTADAVWRHLSIAQVDVEAPVVLAERWDFDSDPQAVLAALEFHGKPAHLVRVGVKDYAALRHPALVRLNSADWVIIRGVAGRRVLVEDRDGLVRIKATRLAEQSDGMAVEDIPALPDGASAVQRLTALVVAQRRTLGLLVLASVVLQSLALVGPEASGRALGRALPDGAVNLLGLLAVCVALAGVATGALGWFRERAILHLMTRLEVAAKRGFLEHVLRLSFPLLQRRTLGELLQAFSGIGAVRTLLAERALGAAFDGVLALAYLALMGSRLWAPTMALAGATAGVVLVAWLAGRAQARQQRAEVAAQARQRGYLAELIAGIRTVKAAGAEDECHGRWVERFRAELACTLSRQRIGLWPQLSLDALQQAFAAIALVWGGHEVLQGKLGVGALFGFILLGDAFLRSLSGLVEAALNLKVLGPQLAGTRALLDAPAEPRVSPSPPRGRAPSLVLRDVGFRYDENGPWVLENFNLQVQPGTVTVLDGPSGFGKSTVLRLLAGLYAPDKGVIRVGGVEPAAARQRMLYLPQFVQLYSGSIMDNLRILAANAPPARLFEAAALTGLDTVVDSLAMKWHTPLPRGGGTLSGGQRQLLALAAALASERDVLLLDEPCANLDPVTAARIDRVLRDSGRTLVIAAHTALNR